MASTGGGGMGMGGGPDSAPGGSSSSSGTGNAENQGMGADAFDANEGASKDFGNTVEGFRAALAKALGQVTQAQKDTAVEAQEEAANQRARDAAVEARDKAIRDAADLGELDRGIMGIDNDDDNDRGLLGPSIDDPQGTQEGLDAEQEARDAIGRSQRSDQEKAMNEAVAIGTQRNISRQDQEKEMDAAYYDDRTIDRQKRENMKAIQDRFGFSPGNPHLDQNLDSPSRESLAKDPRMRDPVFKNLAFDFIDNVLDQKTNSTLETFMGYIMKAFNPALGFGTAMKAMFEALGFDTNPNLGQRAIAAAITAFEGGIPGQRGAGGLMEGERGNSFGEKQAMEALEKVAPWTKGLNQRQIEYYFADGNEEELEWVTNLYNQMNPE